MTTTEATRKTLGDRLRSWRDARGLSQRDIARAAGTRQPTLSQYEAGKRDVPFHVVDAYATALDVSLDLLTRHTYEEAVAAGKVKAATP